MKKLYRNKNGLSTVISTILMIMVVMVGMSIAFTSVVEYTDGYKAGAGSSILESLTIEDVWIKDYQTVQISIYNTGTQANLGADVNVTVTAIYVNGLALTDPSSNSINFNQVIAAGQHATIVGKWSGNFVCGSTYDFKIVTARGSNFETQVKN